MEITKLLQVITSMVSPQKNMNPATSTMVAKTQKSTKHAPLKLPRNRRIVMKIANIEIPIFW